jgi:predicted metal-binding protein
VIACAQLHRQSADGNLMRNTRPERLRGGILARLAPCRPGLDMSGRIH